MYGTTAQRAAAHHRYRYESESEYDDDESDESDEAAAGGGGAPVRPRPARPSEALWLDPEDDAAAAPRRRRIAVHFRTTLWSLHPARQRLYGGSYVAQVGTSVTEHAAATRAPSVANGGRGLATRDV